MERWQRSAKLLVVSLLKINDPSEFSAMSAVPSACYDSGSEDDDQEETLESLGE